MIEINIIKKLTSLKQSQKNRRQNAGMCVQKMYGNKENYEKRRYKFCPGK